MTDKPEDKLARIHLVLNEEPSGAAGDKRAMKRIREILYGKAPVPVKPGDDDKERDEEDDEKEDSDG